MSFADWSIPALVEGYSKRKVSPVEVTQDALDRADAAADLNAFVFLEPNAALEFAKQSEDRWFRGNPQSDIDGIPSTIKDMHRVIGWPTKSGSATYGDVGPIADNDSPCVARLREAGTIFLGKTTVPEFGWKGVTDSPATGITRNPWDATKTPGGSSGGAAVAAALGIGRIHTGSDGGGSIRIPAAFSGVVGLKPSFGAVPAFPLVSTLSSHGCLTASVTETEIALAHIGRPDPRDWLATPPLFTTPLDDASAPLKVAYCACGLGPDPAEEIQRQVELAARTIAGSRGTAVSVSLPTTYDAVRNLIEIFWSRDSAVDWTTTEPEMRGKLDPGLSAMASDGLDLSAITMAAADAARAALASSINVFLSTYDVLILPAAPFEAFEAGQDFPSDQGMRSWLDWAANLYLFNLTQSPALSFPMPRKTPGLPTAVQIVAAKHRDRQVLQAGKRLEQAYPIKSIATEHPPTQNRERTEHASTSIRT